MATKASSTKVARKISSPQLRTGTKAGRSLAGSNMGSYPRKRK
jgi:hypothetical protein